MILRISYYQPPFGWLERIRSDDDLYEMYAATRCDIIHNASHNSLVVENRRFWYTDTAWGLHYPPDAYPDRFGWFRYDFMSGKIAQEEKLVNWLFRLGWRTKFVDSDLFLDWKNRSVPLGKLNRIALEHLQARTQ